MSYFKISLLLYICIWNIADGKRPNFITLWSQLDCQSNPKYIRRLSCSIEQPSHRHFSLEMIAQQDIPLAMSNYTVHFVQPNGQIMHKFSAKSDYCKFFAGKPGNALIAMLREAFDKYATLPRHCPIKKDIILRLDNFTVNADTLPRFTPEANFVTYSTFRSRSKELIMHIKTMGHLNRIN